MVRVLAIAPFQDVKMPTNVSKPIQIRMGGYGPPTTSFSKSLKFIGDKLEAQFADRVDIKYVWNIMDLGFKGEDILWLVEHGLLTLGYQSSSYLTDRVPELGFVDLPFLFANNAQARGAMDGELGAYLVRKTEERINYRILGWFENGFRHISNKLRPVHMPADMTGMKIRVLPSEIQRRTFELLGAVAMRMDLSEAIKMVVDGTLDAQENPLANTVTYGVHKFHKYHTLSSHFYISRPIFFHRTSFDSWPTDIQQAMQKAVTEAVAAQRDMAIEEHKQSLKAILDAGCEVVELNAKEHAAFVEAVQPLLDDSKKMYGEEMFRMLPRA
jgi:tripartite ATP-independent transporter DctP family solute receptor